MAKTLRRFGALLLALVMCCSLMSLTAFAAEDGTTAISEATTITEAGSYCISADFTGTITIAAEGDVYLDLNGCTLTAPGTTSRAIVVNSGALIISDSSADQTGKLVGYIGTTNTTASLIYIAAGAICVLESGTISGENHYSSTTGYVSCYGTFIMKGGAIAGCNASLTEYGVYLPGSTSLAVLHGGSITDCDSCVRIYTRVSSYDPTAYFCGTSYSSECSNSGGSVYDYCPCSVDAHITRITATTDATCTEDGTQVATCYICDGDFTTVTDEATGHNYENGVCTVCGAADPTEEPAIEKVSESSVEKTADCETASAGDVVTYTLTSNIAETMGEAITYTYVDGEAVGTCGEYTLTFHDTMDDGLTINTSSITVTVAGTEIDAKYITTSTDDDCTIDIIVDLAALYNDGIITEADMGIASVVVTYTATVTGDVIGALKNTATVSYEDATSEASTAVVKVYALSIFKYDYADVENGLSGAEFQLTDAEGNVIATVTTDTDGYATITGLAAGEYTLTETQAPADYVCSDEPYTITIDGDGDYTVVYAVANAAIPSTGGMGTTLYTMVGASILLAAAVLFFVNRKKNGEA